MGKQQYHFVSMAEAKKLKKGDIIFIGLRNGTSLTYQKSSGPFTIVLEQ